MNWRPWLIASLLLSTGLALAVSVYFEERPELPGVGEIATDRTDSLRGLRFTATNRRQVLEDMGLTGALLESTLAESSRLARGADRLRDVLRASEAAASVLCFDAYPPARYGATQVLLVEQRSNGTPVRRVVDLQDISALELQSWDFGLARNMYEHIELDSVDRPDSTLVGVAAIILGEEAHAIADEPPFDGTSRDVLGARDTVEDRLVKYIGAMVVLAELANEEGSICASN